MTSFLTRIFSLFVLLLFVVFLCAPAFAGDCSQRIPDNDSWKIQEYLKGCDPKGSIVTDDYTIEGGVKAKVVSFTNQLILAGSILSVGGIVFAAFLYVSALGDAEGVKKAKTALKFSIIGFVVMLLSFPIVNAIVNLVYGIGR